MTSPLHPRDPCLSRAMHALLTAQAICFIGVLVSWHIGDRPWLVVCGALAIVTGCVAIVGALIEGDSQ